MQTAHLKSRSSSFLTRRTLCSGLSHSERGSLAVEEVGLFLADLALLYDLNQLAQDPKYVGHPVSQFTLYRRCRPRPQAEQLQLVRLSKRSPLEVLAHRGLTVGVNEQAYLSAASTLRAFFMARALTTRQLNRGTSRSSAENCRDETNTCFDSKVRSALLLIG